jgi:hypothetical protein
MPKLKTASAHTGDLYATSIITSDYFITSFYRIVPGCQLHLLLRLREALSKKVFSYSK